MNNHLNKRVNEAGMSPERAAYMAADSLIISPESGIWSELPEADITADHITGS